MGIIITLFFHQNNDVRQVKCLHIDFLKYITNLQIIMLVSCILPCMQNVLAWISLHIFAFHWEAFAAGIYCHFFL